MPNALEEIELLHCSANRVSNDIGGYVRSVHAVPAITLQVIEIGLQPADCRHARQDDVDPAAPGKVYGLIAQLRKDFDEPWS